MARLASKNSNLSPTTRKATTGEEQTLATTGGRADNRQAWARRASKSRNSVSLQADESKSPSPVQSGRERGSRLRTQKQTGSEEGFVGLVPGEGVSTSSPVNLASESTTTSRPLPVLLKKLIAFLETLPDKTLNIPPEKAQGLAAFLLSAGLPQEEVERLLFSPTSQEKGLNASDLLAAWQRTQGLVAPQASAKVAEPTAPEATPPPEVEEILADRNYQRLWKRLTLPASELPIVRLALARLGASPQDLAQLEEETAGRSIPLSRIWQVLQNIQEPAAVPTTGQNGQISQGEALPHPDILGERPVTGEELEEWRQVLLKAGLKPEVVEKLLGRTSPATQEILKDTLLALAPPEKPPASLAEPKPLYLPESLRLRPFPWQSQGKGDQSKGGGGLWGEQRGAESGKAASLAASLTSGSSEEAIGVSLFPTELQSLSQQVVGTGASLASTPPTMPFLAPEVRESLWSQLQSGIISNLQPGETQVNLSLNPPELGQIQLTLTLTGQELAVTAVASRPDVAELATLGVQQLLQTLAQQGVVLTQFQVRLQDLPVSQSTPVFAGTRDKGSEPGPKDSGLPRRRSGEVDRFV